MIWAQLLAYVTGTVDQELLLRNEYLAAENRILKAQIKGRLLPSQEEKATLAEIAHRLGRKALEEVAGAAQPGTILGWYRKLIAKKSDGSRFRQRVGRPRIAEEIERLVERTLFRSWYCGVSIAASDTCEELCCSLCFYCARLKIQGSSCKGCSACTLTSFDRQPKYSGIHA